VKTFNPSIPNIPSILIRPARKNDPGVASVEVSPASPYSAARPDGTTRQRNAVETL
jgi:hypothetical protein